MNLKQFSNIELISRMEKLVRTERKITHLVLLHIAEIEERKAFAELGYDGMYSYLTKGLGYSDGSAYRRLQSARLLKTVPEVAEKIESGSLNLTQLTQIQKCLHKSRKNGESISLEQTVEVLNKLEHKNTFESMKTLAQEMNMPVQIHEVIKPQKDDSVRIELTLTAEQYEELKKAQSLLSHICPDGSWADVISELAKKFNKQKESGNKIHQGKVSTQPVVTAEVSSITSTTQRKYISVHTTRSLLKSADNCCQFVDHRTGKRCASRYQLQRDHIRPVAVGGGDEIENLRILCRTHNNFMAQKNGLAARA